MARPSAAAVASEQLQGRWAHLADAALEAASDLGDPQPRVLGRVGDWPRRAELLRQEARLACAHGADLNFSDDLQSPSYEFIRG